MTVQDHSIKLGTFNILAPCYKVLRERRHLCGRGSKKESVHPSLYLARYDKIFKILNSLPDFDFFCLQEYWFNPDIIELFKQKLGERYDIYENKRPMKNDGVALLISRNYIVKEIENFVFQDIGRRVALLAHVAHSETGKEIILVTTHLTFRHSSWDERTRMFQAKKLTQMIDDYIQNLDTRDVPLLLAGDFNGTCEDPIYFYFKERGFSSTFATFHGREPYVTHIDHTGAKDGVDYILYRMPDTISCTVNDAYLVPKEYSDKDWPEEFTASDHRPLLAEMIFSTTK